jgi:excisionase family DNA binding protein
MRKLTAKETDDLERLLTIAIWGHWRDPEQEDRYEAGTLARKIIPYLQKFFEREDEFYTPEEIADVLKVHLQTILHYIRKGDLGAIQLPKGYRIPRTDFEDFRMRHSTSQPSPL